MCERIRHLLWGFSSSSHTLLKQRTVKPLTGRGESVPERKGSGGSIRQRHIRYDTFFLIRDDLL